MATVEHRLIRRVEDLVLAFELQDLECAKCGHSFSVATDMEQGNILEEPRLCPMVGDPERACKGTRFNMVGSRCTDYQEVKVQEHVERLSVGSIPRSMTVVLEHDLVDQCKAGDEVNVVGTLLRR